jgi:hypothetical protein
MKWLIVFLFPAVMIAQPHFEYKKLSNRKFKKEFFDASFYQHQAYFLGDIHGLSNCYDLLLKTTKHLHTTRGVTDLFMERGRDYLFFVNNYVNGKCSMADLLMNLSIKNTQIETENEFEFFDEIKKFNSKLPDSLKVVLHPMFECSTPNTYLNYLFRNIDYATREQDYLSGNIDAFQKLTNMESLQYDSLLTIFDSKHNSTSQSPTTLFTTDPSDERILLEENPSFIKEYEILKDYTKRLLSKKEYFDYREHEMASNIENHIENNKTPFLVFVGMDHVLKVKSKSLDKVDSLFWEIAAKKSDLLKTDFCFIYTCHVQMRNFDKRKGAV